LIVSRRITTLQWGHGISAVEIGIHPTTKIKLHRSSMGPRHLSRGNNKQPMNAAADKAHLQWGHGISAVEITVKAKVAAVVAYLSSMGPRHLSRGNSMKARWVR